MTSPAQLNELSQAEEPARVLLERLGGRTRRGRRWRRNEAKSAKSC